MSYCVHPLVMENAYLRGLRAWRPTHRQVIAFEQNHLSLLSGTIEQLRLRAIVYCAPPVGLRKGGRS